MSNILITGRPGVGKTTLIKEIVSCLNIEARGFYTEELREDNRRVGFEIVEIGHKTQKRACFAHREFEKRYRVGKYGIDLSILDEVGVRAIEEGISENAPIIIDEIGKMELFSKRFRDSVTLSLDSTSPVLATITLSPLPFVKNLKKREDIILKELTRGNREELERDILSNLNR